MKKRDSKKGFTIIEVALVLAIAGLIFLMVFIALPSIQRNQRDAERRDDVSKLLTSIEKYIGNNRGALPTGTGLISYQSTKPAVGTWGEFYYTFLGKDFTDPNGSNYVLNVRDCAQKSGESRCSVDNVENKTFPNSYQILVVRRAICNGSSAVASTNPRNVAILYKLEGPGAYCANTQ